MEGKPGRRAGMDFFERMERWEHEEVIFWLTLFELSEHDNLPPYQAADRFAEERLRRVGALKLRYGQSRDILRRRRSGS
jgi:hypothetical protein